MALCEVNNLTQVGRLTEVAWTVEADGPPHAPQFRWTVRCTDTGSGTRLTAGGNGSTKAAAKAAAARSLLAQLGR